MLIVIAVALALIVAGTVFIVVDRHDARAVAAAVVERDLMVARLELARLRNDHARAVSAWRSLELTLRGETGVDWWVWESAHEQARGTMVRALGLHETAPPSPRAGQVWADPDGDGGVWEICDSALRDEGIEWRVCEIGGERAGWWSREDFHRARFMFDAGGDASSEAASASWRRAQEMAS